MLLPGRCVGSCRIRRPKSADRCVDIVKVLLPECCHNCKAGCCPGGLVRSPDCCCWVRLPGCFAALGKELSISHILSIGADMRDPFLGCRKSSIVGTRVKVVWISLSGHFCQGDCCQICCTGNGPSGLCRQDVVAKSIVARGLSPGEGFLGP